MRSAGFFPPTISRFVLLVAAAAVQSSRRRSILSRFPCGRPFVRGAKVGERATCCRGKAASVFSGVSGSFADEMEMKIVEEILMDGGACFKLIKYEYITVPYVEKRFPFSECTISIASYHFVTQ